MSAPRIHYSASADIVTLCGVMPSVRPSADLDEVTCRLCLAHVERVAGTVGTSSTAAVPPRDRRGDHTPAVLDGPGASVLCVDGEHAIARSIAGEPIDTGPRYWSLRGAMSALAMTQDARRSVASSSDWFNKAGGGSGRAADDSREGAIDLRQSLDRACVAMTVGPHTLSVGMVRAIAEARLFGKPVDRQVATRIHATAGRLYGGRKADPRSKYRERIEASAEEVAELAGLTRVQLGIVLWRVRNALAKELVRKGLLPRRALDTEGAARREEVPVGAPVGWDLEGWKDISKVVGRSPMVCRELVSRSENPLPVRAYLGSVIARRADLAKWVEREVERTAAA